MDTDTLEFGEVAIGKCLDREFVMDNCGSRSLQGRITELCRDFGFAHGGGTFSIAPGSVRYVRIRFTPAEIGSTFCTIETSDTACPTVFCRGVGVRQCCRAIPGLLRFGAVPVGASADLVFSLDNCGDVPLPLYLRKLEMTKQSCAPFTVVTDFLDDTLGAGASACFQVHFAPPVAAFYECRLEFDDSVCHFVFLNGWGTLP